MKGLGFLLRVFHTGVSLNSKGLEHIHNSGLGFGGHGLGFRV